MSLSKELWYQKIRSWIPSWMTENEEYQKAVLYAIAKLLYEAQKSNEENVSETFLDTATVGYLDLHGSERSTERLKNEFDPNYRIRIKNFTNKSNKVTIKSIVDAVLIVGESEILEDFDSFLFFDRDVYYNRGYLLVEKILNAFTIVLDNQKHDPYSFMDREYFMDREDFIGLNESPIELFNTIVEAVNNAKAFGTFYRLYERSGEI